MQVPSSAAPSPEAAAVPIRCGNTTKSGKLLFRFPKGRGRAAAVGASYPLRTGPPTNWYPCGDSSVICSEHFAPACFDVSSVIQKNLHFSERLRPVAGAASILHPVSSLLKPTGKAGRLSGQPGREESPRQSGSPRLPQGQPPVHSSGPRRGLSASQIKGHPKRPPRVLQEPQSVARLLHLVSSWENHLTTKVFVNR
ncbi:LOW QUALITY PROTEIN: THAP domain-containing protein 10 [Capricornis sumatraensis]|uniref:LOW QUALITY PROTEIN: THAP domain-containing protein 10 n=1 Tax=Capricornis sumatraensis TaxID=34865 RepID=UPI0036053AF3